MSFILDALKKSETERQQQVGAEFSNVPSSAGNPQPLRWLWILGLLLLFNIVVLVSLLIRTNKSVDEMPVEQPQIAETSFEEKIAEAKQNQPEHAELLVTKPAEEIKSAVSRPTSTLPRGRVLTIDEVRLNGTLQMTELALDIHVYSDNPAERFVFINMAKHREQSQLEEGPVVVEITPDGVVLDHQGTIFLLPRE